MEQILKSGKHLAVCLCGAIGLVLTISLIVLINQITGFNLFSFNLYAIVPIGGMIAGFAACSGYYFASIKFDLRPNRMVLSQMVLSAALAQLMIYYAEFRLMRFEDGTAVSTVMGFLDYVQAYLRSTHIYGGRGFRDLGALGGIGWFIAVIEYLGFLLGGLAAYLALLTHPVCQSCARYLKTVARKNQIFSDPAIFSVHYHALAEMGGDAERFRSLLALTPPNGQKGVGAVKLVTLLQCCPHCNGERIEQQVKILAEKGWRSSAAHARHYDIPDGVSVRDCFGPSLSNRECSGASAKE